jgi:hypothetical protein
VTVERVANIAILPDDQIRPGYGRAALERTLDSSSGVHVVSESESQAAAVPT